jgi:probable rRNA maturation factor
MKYQLNYQNPNEYKDAPNIFHVQRWLTTALTPLIEKAELAIRIVDSKEIQDLNKQYRQQDKPTNVLSFPFELPEAVKETMSHPMLGDIIICHSFVVKEAKQQNKELTAHYAHMIIHGALHLLGYDHIKQEDAAIMEPLEITALSTLGFNNPYEICND